MADGLPDRPGGPHGAPRRGVGVLLVVLALLLAPGVVATSLAAEPTGKVHRVAFIGFHSPGLENRLIAYFGERLAELGYVEGRNLSITFRWANGQLSNYPAIAADVVHSSVDVIVSPCGPIVGAIRKLDATVPLVVRSVDVKTCEGEIDTLDRPGGYTTGAISIAHPGMLPPSCRGPSMGQSARGSARS